MSTATHPKLSDAKRFARNITPVVNELLTTRLIAERVKKQIDDECSRILSSGEFRYANKWYDYSFRGDKLPEDRILRNVAESYLMHDEDAKRYYQLRANYIESAGWKCPRDYCPASMAESKCIECENAIISAMADMMNCPNLRDAWGETREKALELSIGLVVNLSSYRNPPMATEWLGKSL
jgi:hypothetical protein